MNEQTVTNAVLDAFEEAWEFHRAFNEGLLAHKTVLRAAIIP